MQRLGPTLSTEMPDCWDRVCSRVQASVLSAVISSQLTVLGTHPASPSGEAGLSNLEPTSHVVRRGATQSESSHLNDYLCWDSLVRGAEQAIVEVSTFWASS